MDFTIKTYLRLLSTLIDQGFSFLTFNDFILNSKSPVIILRHDADRLPGNSLEFAKIQKTLGIKGTYYFRTMSGSLDEKIIIEIAGMGHEIGYHYEDLSFAWAKLKAQSSGLRAERKKYIVSSKEYLVEDFERYLAGIAIGSFTMNLEKLRKIVPVKTICMHGSPMSRWDSRLLWKYYDYHDFGIIGEPYFDVNFDEVIYLTDTGRRWDGDSFNIRDKSTAMRQQSLYNKIIHRNKQQGTSNQQPATYLKFHSTFDIITAAEKNKLPDKIMMTFHPQRWMDKPVPWVKELVWQNMKNVAKYFIIKVNSE